MFSTHILASMAAQICKAGCIRRSFISHYERSVFDLSSFQTTKIGETMLCFSLLTTDHQLFRRFYGIIASTAALLFCVAAIGSCSFVSPDGFTYQILNESNKMASEYNKISDCQIFPQRVAHGRPSSWTIGVCFQLPRVISNATKEHIERTLTIVCWWQHGYCVPTARQTCGVVYAWLCRERVSYCTRTVRYGTDGDRPVDREIHAHLRRHVPSSGCYRLRAPTA